MRCAPRILALSLPALALLGACAAPLPSITPAGFAGDTHAALAQIGPYGKDGRLAYYTAMDTLAQRLWRSPLAQARLETKGTVFGGDYPRLVLSDRDGDAWAEGWAYLPAGNDRSQIFGFIFDTNQDGLADYVIYNAGLEPAPAGAIWHTEHLIDSNADGRLDVLVVNAIALRAPPLVDAGVSAWLYDSDFDGQIDAAEYLGPGLRQPIERIAGAFRVRHAADGVRDYDAWVPRRWDQTLRELKTTYVLQGLPPAR